MASITIRNLEDEIKQRLRVRAAEHGRSMEEEARDILRRVMGEGAPPRNLAAAIRARVAPASHPPPASISTCLRVNRCASRRRTDACQDSPGGNDNLSKDWRRDCDEQATHSDQRFSNG